MAQRDAGVDPLDPSPLLLPGPNESPAAYLERLQALHRRLGALITTIEQRREMRPEPPSLSASLRAAVPPAPGRPQAPLPPARRPVVPPPVPAFEPVDETGEPLDWPAYERRHAVERRVGAVERRIGLRDRRRGAIDERQLRTERRTGPRDRRIGSDNRRRGLDRRGEARREPWQKRGFRLDRTVLVWLIQVTAWVTIAVVALLVGLGHS